jgi:hypothetical protein
VLVREPRTARKEGSGGLIAAGIGLAVIVVVGAVAWTVGLLPFRTWRATEPTATAR